MRRETAAWLRREYTGEWLMLRATDAALVLIGLFCAAFATYYGLR